MIATIPNLTGVDLQESSSESHSIDEKNEIPTLSVSGERV